MNRKLLKYQGATLTGGAPGASVLWQGVTWTVTASGHLESVDTFAPTDEIAPGLTAQDFVDTSAASWVEV
jgi:hypothetical protein